MFWFIKMLALYPTSLPPTPTPAKPSQIGNLCKFCQYVYIFFFLEPVFKNFLSFVYIDQKKFSYFLPKNDYFSIFIHFFNFQMHFCNQWPTFFCFQCRGKNLVIKFLFLSLSSNHTFTHTHKHTQDTYRDQIHLQSHRESTKVGTEWE